MRLLFYTKIVVGLLGAIAAAIFAYTVAKNEGRPHSPHDDQTPIHEAAISDGNSIIAGKIDLFPHGDGDWTIRIVIENKSDHPITFITNSLSLAIAIELFGEGDAPIPRLPPSVPLPPNHARAVRVLLAGDEMQFVCSLRDLVMAEKLHEIRTLRYVYHMSDDYNREYGADSPQFQSGRLVLATLYR